MKNCEYLPFVDEKGRIADEESMTATMLAYFFGKLLGKAVTRANWRFVASGDNRKARRKEYAVLRGQYGEAREFLHGGGKLGAYKRKRKAKQVIRRRRKLERQARRA